MVSERISSGIQSDLLADKWAAVRSHDFKSVYFVAGHLSGPGVDDSALWATNRLEDGGLTFSVDALAKEFSDWGGGGTTKAEMTIGDDGASQALDCIS